MRTVGIEKQKLIDHIEKIPPDGMHIFILQNGTDRNDALRGAVLNGTRLVNEMRSAHELGILESYILGQAYLAALLMTRSLKGAGRLNLEIGCSGPVQGLSVEAGASGEVRGYLKEVPIPIEGPVESFDTAPFFGPGILTVNRYPDGSLQGFSGNIDLLHGNLAEDIARYYLVSEQTRTTLILSIKFDADGDILGAGGLFIEALPGASDAFIEQIQGELVAMPSLGASLAEGKSGRVLVSEQFDSENLIFMEEREVRFYCACSRERFKSFIGSMKVEELHDIAENGPFPLRTICHNCNSIYEFDQEELRQLAARAEERN